MDIQHVKQEEPYGCVIACIAMILGKTYQEIKSMLPTDRGYGNRNGMTSHDMISFLWLHGYIGLEFYKCESHTQRMRELNEWLKPVATFNKVSVINEYGPHAILWMPDGRVFDPNKYGVHSITDYKEYHSLTAFWNLSAVEKNVNTFSSLNQL